jgi:hypothetical protein
MPTCKALKTQHADEPYVSAPILDQALELGIALIPGDDSQRASASSASAASIPIGAAPWPEMDILGITPQALADLLGQPLKSIELEKDTEELGGRSGSDAALVRVQTTTSEDLRLILKYLPPRKSYSTPRSRR